MVGAAFLLLGVLVGLASCFYEIMQGSRKTYRPKGGLTRPASSGIGAVSYGGYYALSGNPDTARPPSSSSPSITGYSAPRSGSFITRRPGESRPLQGGSFLPPVREESPYLVLPANEHCFVQELVGPSYEVRPPRTTEDDRTDRIIASIKRIRQDSDSYTYQDHMKQLLEEKVDAELGR